MHSPCSSFAISSTGEGGEGYLIGGREGGLEFRVLVSTGGLCSDNSNGGVGITAAAPYPNRAPTCGDPEILVPTTTLSGLGRYRGW